MKHLISTNPTGKTSHVILKFVAVRKVICSNFVPCSPPSPRHSFSAGEIPSYKHNGKHL